MKSTRSDVALEAGVSVTTVSHVINKSKNVTKEVEDRVNQAIRKLNYKPNIVARSLATNKTHQVAMIVDNMKNPHYNEILEGAHQTAYARGYLLSVVPISYTSPQSIDNLVNRGFEGAILTLPRSIVQDYIPDYFPTVIIEDCIEIDYKPAFNNMVTLLQNSGHKKIAFLSGLKLNNPDHYRYYYFKKALENVSLPLDESLIIDGDSDQKTDEKSGEIAMEKLFERNKPFTAVFASNDLMAIGASSVIKRKGYSIPEDYSIVGFDNIELSKFIYPSLSTFSINPVKVGEILMKSLINLIEGRDLVKVQTEISFIERASVTQSSEIIGGRKNE